MLTKEKPVIVHINSLNIENFFKAFGKAAALHCGGEFEAVPKNIRLKENIKDAA